MVNSSQSDIQLSHRVLNYLQALAHAEVSFAETMAELGSPEVTEESVRSNRTTLETILRWYRGLEKSECILSASWKSPQTYEAQKAVRLIDDFISKTRALSVRLRRLPSDLTEVGWEQQRFAFCAVRRGYISESFYNQGAFDLARLVKNEDQIERTHHWAVVSMKLIEEFDKQFMAPAKSKKFSPSDIRDLSIRLDQQTSVLDYQEVDLIELWGIYNDASTRIDQLFDPMVLAQWRHYGFPPSVGARWKAFSFSPEIASAWNKLGIEDPGTAWGWVKAGYSPDTAKSWLPLQLPPLACRAWQDANFDPDLALSFVKRGFMHPNDVPSN